MKTNIPIYRAKKVDSDEYVEGFYFESQLFNGNPEISTYGFIRFRTDVGLDNAEVDPSTLAIHFPDMIDRKGNKIFASINKNGKGSSIIFTHILGSTVGKVYLVYNNFEIIAKLLENGTDINIKCCLLKVTGIKE